MTPRQKVQIKNPLRNIWWNQVGHIYCILCLDFLKPTFYRLVIIDLLPQAHHKAVSYRDGVRVDFVCEKNGKRKPSGHFGKLIKGRFIRWLCETKTADPKRFSLFNEDGYQWNGECFVKDED